MLIAALKLEIKFMDARLNPYIFLTVAADSAGGTEMDVIGLSYLDPFNPVSAEIRTNIGEHVSRLVMRPVRLVLPCPGCCENSPAIIAAWECIDVSLAVSRGFVRLFQPWNPPDRAEVNAIRSDFAFAVQPFFRERRKREPEAWMKMWVN